MFTNSIIKNRIVINVIILTILLFLFRTSIPQFKYPFFLTYSFVVLYIIINFKIKNLRNLKVFFTEFRLVFVLTTLLLVCFLLTYKIYLSVFKDIINILILLSLFYALSITIRTEKDLVFFSKVLVRLFIFFAFFIAIWKFFDTSKVFIDPATYNIRSLSDKSPYIDWNFSLLPVFFALVSLLSLLTLTSKVKQKVLYYLLLLFFSYNILLSKSRRGIILLMVIISIMLIIMVISFFKSNQLVKKLNSVSKRYLLLIAGSFLFLYLAVFHSSFYFKSYIMKKLFAREELNVKYNVAVNLHRNLSSFKINIPFEKVYNRIWSVKWDPFDPDVGGWGTNQHTTIFPLSGKNVEIVPKSAKGYRQDCTTNGVEWNGNAYSETTLKEIEVKQFDSIIVKINCFISNDYSGETAFLNVEGNAGILKHSEYDLNNKGMWQTISLRMLSEENKTIRIYCGFWRWKVPDFANLKGYIIFANPDIEIINNSSSHLSGNLKDDNPNRVLLTGGKSVPDVRSRIKNLSVINYDRVNYSRIGPLSYLDLLSTLLPGNQTSKKNDKDPFRRWISSLISQDTAYKGYKEHFSVDTIKNAFTDLRIVRWQLASEIFLREYNWHQKLIGGGFKFLNWYGYYFYGDKTKDDYPHNPFLHILLYSGLLGLSLYLLMLYKVLAIYLRFIKVYYLFLLFFLIAYFFTFFSGGNPFDPPMMGFFMMLPFFINGIHRSTVLNDSVNGNE